MREIASIRNTIAVLGLMAAIAMASAASAAKMPPSSPVDINTASVEQLMEVPGIGHSKAQAIVEYRAGSPFSSTAELMNVKGIGEKLLAKIMPYVTAGNANQTRSGTAGRAAK